MKTIVVALSLASAGCTVVNIHGAVEGDVEVTRRFGIVSLEVSPKAGAVMVESSSLGALRSVDGFFVGYKSASLAAVSPESCRLVVWIRTDEQLQELNSMLRDYAADLCVVRPNNPKG